MRNCMPFFAFAGIMLLKVVIVYACVRLKTENFALFQKGFSLRFDDSQANSH